MACSYTGVKTCPKTTQTAQNGFRNTLAAAATSCTSPLFPLNLSNYNYVTKKYMRTPPSFVSGGSVINLS